MEMTESILDQNQAAKLTKIVPYEALPILMCSKGMLSTLIERVRFTCLDKSMDNNSLTFKIWLCLLYL